MVDALERGRQSYGRRAWADAYRSLSLADQVEPLRVEDLERLAVSAYLSGRDEDFLTALDRAHHEYLNAGDSVRAARSAFWSGLSLLLRGEVGRATGWLGRARRLVDRRDCVEQGYLLLPETEQQLAGDSYEAAYRTASEAGAIAERFGDRDLIACARHLQGRALIQQGQVPAGLALLDEAMLAATADELSPIMTGLIYCSVIEACQTVYAFGRAREWTWALSKWCEQQPEMVAFTSTCLVHRAAVLRLSGAWPAAIEEARRACERDSPSAAAFYQRAEVHRLRGEYAAAEAAYRDASQGGWEPQPGLALLRLAEGRTEAADATIRRVLSGTTGRLQRAQLLPAYIEIMLAVGDSEQARAACRELEEIAARFDTGVLGATAAHARGAVQLADGHPQPALVSLRHAMRVWQEVEAPYEAARARVLAGVACRALGDEEGAGLELEAARAAFERLGAAPDLDRMNSLTDQSDSDRPHGLTPRELEVLRLVATGKTNKAIAAELFLSDRTVERHLSNIFKKLNVNSRTAATARAYEYDLI